MWGVPRLSADVDITIRLRHDQSTPAFVSAMRSAGFELRISDVDDFVRKTRVLPFVHRASRIPLDVVLAGPGPEEEFIARARRVSVSGVVVPVLSPEDLIVTKVLAGRPKDLEDIRGIISKRGKELDLSGTRALLRLLEEGLGQSDLLPLLEAQIAAVLRAKR